MGLLSKEKVTLVPRLNPNLASKGDSNPIGMSETYNNESSRTTMHTLGIGNSGISYRVKLNLSLDKIRGVNRTLNAKNCEFYLTVNRDGRLIVINEQGEAMPDVCVKLAREEQPEAVNKLLKQASDESNRTLKSITDFVFMIPEPIYRSTFVPEPFEIEFPEQHKTIVVFDPPPPEPPKVFQKKLLYRVCPYLKLRSVRRYRKELNLYRKMLKSHNEKLNAQKMKLEEQERKYQESLIRFESEKIKYQNKMLMARRTWEVAIRNNIETMSLTFNRVIHDISWPREIQLSFGITPDTHVIVIDVDLPKIEDFPTKTTVLKEDYLNITKISETKRRKLYADYIMTVGLILCGSAFRCLPTIQSVVISGYSQRLSKATGNVSEDYLYSCIMSRREFSQINFNQLDCIEPFETMKLGTLRCEVTKTFFFNPITPFVLENVAYPVLKEVT